MGESRWDRLLLPLISLVLGIYLVLRPWSATEAICAFIGWLILLAGAAGAFNAVLFQRATLISTPLLPVSVAGLVIGVFFITRPYTLIEIVGLVICVLLMLEGMTNIQNALQRYRWGDRVWWMPLVVGILCLVLGLMALFAPWASTAMMMRLIGIMLICSGAVSLLSLVFGRRE